MLHAAAQQGALDLGEEISRYINRNRNFKIGFHRNKAQGISRMTFKSTLQNYLLSFTPVSPLMIL